MRESLDVAAAASRVLGRRATVKYLALGAAAAVSAACGGGRTATPSSPATGMASGNGSVGGSAAPSRPPVSERSVLGQAISAFLVGEWTMDAVVSTDEGTTFPPVTVTVGKDGSWAAVWRGQPPSMVEVDSSGTRSSGTWQLSKQTLVVRGFDSPVDSGLWAEGRAVPDALAATALVGWAERNPSEEAEPAVGPPTYEQVPVAWDESTQTLTFPLTPGGLPELTVSLRKLTS